MLSPLLLHILRVGNPIREDIYIVDLLIKMCEVTPFCRNWNTLRPLGD